MKLWILPVLTIFMVLTAERSYGWYEKGNGGDVLVCRDGVNLLYDFYEAQVRHEIKILLPDTQPVPNVENESGLEDLPEVLRIAEIILDRVRSQDVELAVDLRERLKRFHSEVAFYSGVELADIEDFGIGYIPLNCDLKQLIIQRPPQFPEDRRYVIALDYWRTLSVHQKSIGVVHEILYNYALSINPRIYSSEPIRYFNALLMGDQVELMRQNEYRSLKRRIFLSIMERND